MPSPTLICAVEQWGGASAVPVAAALGGAGGGARRARRQRAVALRFVGAPGVLLGPLYRQPRRWSGAGGAGERDGTRRRVAGGSVRGSSMGRPRGGALGKRRPCAGGAVPQSPALCARLDTAPCRLGAAQLRRARTCAVVARAAVACARGSLRAA